MNSKHMNKFNTIAVSIFLVGTLVLVVSACISSTSALSDSPPPTGIEQTETTSTPPSVLDDSSPTDSPTASPSDNILPLQSGETMTFEYAGLILEITNVSSERIESLEFPDDPYLNFDYTVYKCYRGAQLTVISAAMTDGGLTESGLPNPNWYVSLNSGGRIPITDDMAPLDITDDMAGIISGEGSSFALSFEWKD